MTNDQPPPIPDEHQFESKTIAFAANRARRSAERIAKDPERAVTLIETAEAKVERAGKSISSVVQYLRVFARMLRAYFSRKYTALPWRTVVWSLAALAYFVWPIDLIPDILLVGFLDDAAVIMYVVRQIQKDLDAFLAWESEQPAADAE